MWDDVREPLCQMKYTMITVYSVNYFKRRQEFIHIEYNSFNIYYRDRLVRFTIFLTTDLIYLLICLTFQDIYM